MPEEQRLRESPVQQDWDVIIVGGGFAGLSAAIYLGRAMRRVLVLDAEESLAKWEPEVQNYFGFPEGISGPELLRRGRVQAERYGARILVDEIERAEITGDGFSVDGRHVRFQARKLLLATGLYHLPPNIAGVNECVGKSLFFCKDCDGFKVRDRALVVVGHNNETVEYALGLTVFSQVVAISTNGENCKWDEAHARWVDEFKIPVHRSKVLSITHDCGNLSALQFEDGAQLIANYVFTTRGDIYYNELARQLGAEIDSDGQVVVDHCQRTSVPGLFAAGCVTQANCQMIIAAGHGAAAGQAMNRELFEESLEAHNLRRPVSPLLREAKISARDGA